MTDMLQEFLQKFAQLEKWGRPADIDVPYVELAGSGDGARGGTAEHARLADVSAGAKQTLSQENVPRQQNEFLAVNIKHEPKTVAHRTVVSQQDVQ